MAEKSLVNDETVSAGVDPVPVDAAVVVGDAELLLLHADATKPPTSAKVTKARVPFSFNPFRSNFRTP
jgi:hypothetical protein